MVQTLITKLVGRPGPIKQGYASGASSYCGMESSKNPAKSYSSGNC